jgi:universal stress protein F
VKQILVALDESERAPHVLEAAVTHARAVGGQLQLLRVCPLYPYTALAYSSPVPQALPDLLEDEARRQLTELAHGIPAAVRGPVHVRVGVPWQQVCAVAVELDVDLIIIGAHGYHVIERVLGTTSARVVNHADRTVMVVRSPDQRLPRK